MYLTGGHEPLAAEHACVDGEPIGAEGNTASVGELAPCAVELAADVGAS